MLEQVLKAVREVAATEIMPHFMKADHTRKADGTLCTTADIAAQEALIARLSDIHRYPVVGEEMTSEQQLGQWAAGTDGLWCIDPIDGTSNFVHGAPYFAVSVALMREGRSVLGVVFDPVANEAFYAEAGKGAFLNGVPLAIREPVPDLARAIAGIDVNRLPRTLATAIAVRPPFSSPRVYGASTLEWCYTAAGRLDVYVHGGQKLWDYAAGSLILAEAGGAMCTLENDDFWASALWQRSVIASRDPGLFTAWKQWVREHA